MLQKLFVVFERKRANSFTILNLKRLQRNVNRDQSMSLFVEFDFYFLAVQMKKVTECEFRLKAFLFSLFVLLE